MSEPPASPSAIAAGFTRILRGAGLDVSMSSTVLYAQALAAVGLQQRHDVYWAGRAALVHDPEDRETYDRCFSMYWERQGFTMSGLTATTAEITIALDTGHDDEAPHENDGDSNDEPTIHVRFSRAEVLRHKDFSEYTPDELDEFHRLISEVSVLGALRPSRRLVSSSRRSASMDLRRTVRASLSCNGETMRVHHRRSTDKPRRVILLVDVSGSMEPYARALTRFAHAAVVGHQRVEVFALGTRLTRLTRELSSRDPDGALRRAADAVVDWAGGTRLGDGLAVFNDQWGQRGMARGAVVVILSDGWDRGDPEIMAEQMCRLSRAAHRIVWVNPLKATTGYAPLARGMAAALPYIDHFVEGHSLDALQRLADVLSSTPRHRTPAPTISRGRTEVSATRRSELAERRRINSERTPAPNISTVL
jgi:uncharacterized protein